MAHIKTDTKLFWGRYVSQADYNLGMESLSAINNSVSTELEISNNEISRLTRHCNDRDRMIIDKDRSLTQALATHRSTQSELAYLNEHLETAGILLKICIAIILTLTGVLILK